MEKTSEIPQDISIKITPEKVLFFDMDGTLIDTNLTNFLSYKKAIKSVMKLDLNLIYDSDKRFTRTDLNHSIPNLSKTEYEKIIQEKEKYYIDFITETKLITEITAILFKYSKTNTTILVTNCREERAIATLNHHDLMDKFDDFFYREFTENEKINKFQNAILKLGITPSSVIIFENEEVEISDAKKVGIKIINPKIN